MRGFKYIFTVFVLITNVINSYACSCIGKSTVKQSVKSSDVILVGKIISRKEISIIDSAIYKDLAPTDARLYEMKYVKFSVVIEELYKGKYKNDTISVYTGTGNGDCGFGFTIGEKYILYGRKKTGLVKNEPEKTKDRNIIWTSTCTRTKPYNEEEINEIRKYKKGKK